jgi:hypothetical protein
VGACHNKWASGWWTHLIHTLHAPVHVLLCLPAQQSKACGTGTYICKGRQPLSTHMYLTCSTQARMSGTDTTLLCGAARPDSLQACEVDQTCQYHQHGLHMSVPMPKKIAHVRAQVSACRQFWTQGPAGQSLMGPLCESVGGSSMPENCGARMSETGGPNLSEYGPNVSELWGSHVRAWWVPCPIPIGPTCSRGTYWIH